VRPLLPGFPEWKSVLVGRALGKDQAWAERLRASTENGLVLAGEHSNVVPWYQGLSILVHPSYGEAFSMVLVEAMACGCCPVVTRLPHVPAVIEHGRTGFMYEPGDVASLRELLRMLFQEPERARRVGLHAAEEARARFGVTHEARALLQVYQAALSG
jgi:mannosyltransferase